MDGQRDTRIHAGWVQVAVDTLTQIAVHQPWPWPWPGALPGFGIRLPGCIKLLAWAQGSSADAGSTWSMGAAARLRARVCACACGCVMVQGKGGVRASGRGCCPQRSPGGCVGGRESIHPLNAGLSGLPGSPNSHCHQEARPRARPARRHACLRAHAAVRAQPAAQAMPVRLYNTAGVADPPCPGNAKQVGTALGV